MKQVIECRDILFFRIVVRTMKYHQNGEFSILLFYRFKIIENLSPGIMYSDNLIINGFFLCK